MTNEEAIVEFKQRLPIKDYKEQIPEYYSAMELAISALEENSKLKAEIEQLKTELEQSVKLPCKVGNVVYVVCHYFDCKIDYECRKYDEIGDNVCDGCENNFKEYFIREEKFKISLIEDIGKTIFLTQEEAEQHLKGKVEE